MEERTKPNSFRAMTQDLMYEVPVGTHIETELLGRPTGTPVFEHTLAHMYTHSKQSPS